MSRFYCAFLFALGLAAFAVPSSRAAALTNPQPDPVYVVLGPDHHVVVRALTQAASCPAIEWNGGPAQGMALRALPARVPARTGSAQTQSKEAVFDLRVCEAQWPLGVSSARVAGQEVPAPRKDIRRIVIIADTGCRMKGSEKAFQPCNDALQWPFARIAQSAAATRPDLVIHIGDIHYRESPCPEGNKGCAGSPWGYGDDAWRADLFAPARPLLAAAPWVFVRGNHESCSRAGQGWFRFIDALPWSETRSCNDPALDAQADYAEPYAVPLGDDAQFIVFDSSRTNGAPFSTEDAAFGKYTQQLLSVARMAMAGQSSFFLSHHPLLAVAPSKKSDTFKPAGNEGLQSVFGALYPERLFPEGVALTLHGHVHLFESISFKGAHPASLVLGNSGSANEGRVPQTLPAGTQLYPGIEVEDYAARSEFGFATLERVASGANDAWLLTEHAVDGTPLLQCAISGGKSRCHPPLAAGR